MQRDQLDPDEPIYVISIAARMVNLHPQTLRHYETLGLVKPARTAAPEGPGLRLYSQRDIERLRKIKSLMEDLGVNLAGVEVILNMSRQIEELQAKVEWMEGHFSVEVERQLQAALQDQRQHQSLLPNSTTHDGL